MLLSLRRHPPTQTRPAPAPAPTPPTAAKPAPPPLQPQRRALVGADALPAAAPPERGGKLARAFPLVAVVGQEAIKQVGVGEDPLVLDHY